MIQSRTRLQIRQSIGRAIGAIIGTATSTVDTTSLIDTTNLVGSDDEHNGKQVIIYDATGSIVDGETRLVTDFVGSTSDATTTAFSASITSGDKYEIWPHPFIVADVNDAIDRAIIDVTRKTLQNKQTTGNFTLSGIYEYAWLSGFVGLHTVEYVANIGIEYNIHSCDVVWDELVDGDVNASVDSAFNVEGSGCLKLVVAAGASANDILATDSIASLDISDCDQIEIFIRSTVALNAGDIHLLLDDTASCATPVETLDIPATSANTDTYHIISLANPTSDSAIISVGIEMETDKGAFTLYVDRIKGVKSTSRVYKELSPEHWDLVKGSTNYLQFTPDGLFTAGTNNQMRLNGYAMPAIMTADSDTSEVDPEFLIEWSLSYLMLYHAKSRQLDIDGRADLGKAHLSMAERKKMQMSLNFRPDTRFV